MFKKKLATRYNRLLAGTAIFILVSGFFFVPLEWNNWQPLPKVQVAEATLPTIDFLNAAGLGVNTGSTVTSTTKTVQSFVIQLLGSILKQIATVLLNKLTQSTINWINGGFNGAPQFIQNPTSYFKNVGDVELENVIDTIGYNASKYPYGSDVSKALIAQYKYQNGSIAGRINFTLDQVIGTDWNKFSKDFSIGGWNGYQALLTNQANNPYGTYLLSQGIATNNIKSSQTSVQQQLNTAGGFLNQRQCIAWRNGPQTGGSSNNSSSSSSSSSSTPDASGGNPSGASQLTGTTPSTGYDWSAGTTSQFTAPGNSTGGDTSSSSSSGSGTGSSGTSGSGSSSSGSSGSGSGGSSSAAAQIQSKLDSAQLSVTVDQAMLEQDQSSTPPASASDIAKDQQQLSKDQQLVQQLQIQLAQANEHTFLLGGAKTDADCLQWQTLSPGSIVASQIYSALGSKFTQTQLGAALGNSISSIVSAATTALLNKGLNALASVISKSNTQNTPAWTYDGQSLSPDTGNTTCVNGNCTESSGDQNVDFNELFYVGQDIGSTDSNGNPQLLTLIQQEDELLAANKGIINIFSGGQPTANGPTPSFAQLIKNLDDATPGPKFGWEGRLTTIMQNAQELWSTRAQNRIIKARKQEASDISEALGNYSTEIPDQIKIQVLSTTIPSYGVIQALIQNATGYSSNEAQYVDAYTTALGTLSRLKAMKASLDLILTHDLTNTNTSGTPDTNLQQFVSSNATTPPPTPVACPQANDLPCYPPNVITFLNQNPGANPFDYLNTNGQQALNIILSEYSLMQNDLPNSGVISQAQDAEAQVQAQADSLTTEIAQARLEVAQNTGNYVYQATLGGNKGIFIQPAADSPATLVDQVTTPLPGNIQSAINTQGYYYAGPGNPIYFSPLGTSTITGIPSDSTGFANIPPAGNSMTGAQIDAALAASPYNSGSMDSDHTTEYSQMSDQQKALVYSLVVDTSPVDLGDGWDSTSTGTTRLQEAIDVVSDYDGEPSANQNETGEMLFYCQSVLDKFDDQSSAARGTYPSLFHRPKVDITCPNFYDSKLGDYTST